MALSYIVLLISIGPTLLARKINFLRRQALLPQEVLFLVKGCTADAGIEQKLHRRVHLDIRNENELRLR